jgi:hypothetical protein
MDLRRKNEAAKDEKKGQARRPPPFAVNEPMSQQQQTLTMPLSRSLVVHPLGQMEGDGLKAYPVTD